MAFALTSAEFRSIEFQNPSFKRGIQEVALTVTGAATDIDLDIGDIAGTFWVAAAANGTYGAMAALVLAQFTAMAGNVAFFRSLICPVLQSSAYLQVASSPGASQYSLTTDTYGPNILLQSGSAPLAYNIVLQYELVASAFPISAQFNK